MKKRTTQPKNNKYYIRQVSGGLNGAVAGCPTIAGANVLCNCVGFANGRYNEIINDSNLEGIVKPFKYQLVCNAENFIESAQRQGLKISRVPTLGGIMVWQKGATLGGGDGAGHVAVVEEIYNDGTILTSESGWNAWAFKLVHRNNSNGRWGQNSAYKFRGCIINPSIKDGKSVDPPKLVIDGIGGTETVYRMQEFFDTPADGVISGQNLSLQDKYYPSLTAVEGGSGGSPCIKKLQRWVGASQDGVLGQKTVKAWQKKIGVTADGIFGPNSMKTWQKYLNEHSKPVYPPEPKPRKKYKVIDVSEWQGVIDFAKVKADGVVGVIIRYADGNYVDKYFTRNMTNAKKAGLHMGSYIFSRAKTKAQAEDEAKRIFNACKKFSPDMPLYIDLEDNSLKLYANSVGNAFIAKIKELGGFPGVYANVNWWDNYLTKVKAPAVWVAQYYKECQYDGDYGMWQYSSSGSVKGISGRVDMNECYVAYWEQIKPEPKPTPTPSEKKTYQGTFPSLRLKKSTSKVISDAVTWALKVAENNSFHYGHGKHSHHNGCYYCETQRLKKDHGINKYETTYCCNPFVGAAWAHGGCVPKALKMCESCDSWDFGTGAGSYAKSNLFEKVSLKSLKKGDVLCSDSHVALYIGGGKVVQAGHEDDNAEHSESWDDSIAVGTWSGYKRAYRFKGKVDADMPLRHGEYSTRVSDLQRFLVWYGCKISVTGFFNKSTLEAVKTFQTDQKLVADGIVGEKTIKAMKAVKK